MQHWCQEWGLTAKMAQFDLPLPEITAALLDVIPHGYRCEGMEQAEMHGQLFLHYYREASLTIFWKLGDEQKATLAELKAAQADHAGLCTDSLQAARKFMNLNQQGKQCVADYAASLKVLFEKAYKDEPLMSPVLLQRFLMGLQLQTSR